jgi:hypothetical protein
MKNRRIEYVRAILGYSTFYLELNVSLKSNKYFTAYLQGTSLFSVI